MLSKSVCCLSNHRFYHVFVPDHLFLSRNRAKHAPQPPSDSIIPSPALQSRYRLPKIFAKKIFLRVNKKDSNFSKTLFPSPICIRPLQQLKSTEFILVLHKEIKIFTHVIKLSPRTNIRRIGI